MRESECERVAEFFTIFACKTRLRLFCLLQEGEQTVSDLARAAGTSVQNVSQHLRMMRDKGAVSVEKDGKFAKYSIADERFLQGAQLIRDGLLDVLQRRARL